MDGLGYPSLILVICIIISVHLGIACTGETYNLAGFWNVVGHHRHLEQTEMK
jgi:hypothetical protein